jgi:hypothetical protein
MNMRRPTLLQHEGLIPSCARDRCEDRIQWSAALGSHSDPRARVAKQLVECSRVRDQIRIRTQSGRRPGPPSNVSATTAPEMRLTTGARKRDIFG